MKRVISLSLSGLLILALLAACGGGLSGTYEGEYGETIKFSGNKITMSAMGMDIPGTYKISGDTITIKLEIFGITEEETASFSQSGNTIYIDGEKYVKK